MVSAAFCYDNSVRYREGADHDKGTKEIPLAKHHPITKTVEMRKQSMQGVAMPDLDPAKFMDTDREFEEWAFDTYEWLSLVGLGSPRVLLHDSIDPYLSRYQVPGEPGCEKHAITMISLTWEGLLPREWIQSLFIQVK